MLGLRLTRLALSLPRLVLGVLDREFGQEENANRTWMPPSQLEEAEIAHVARLYESAVLLPYVAGHSIARQAHEQCAGSVHAHSAAAEETARAGVLFHGSMWRRDGGYRAAMRDLMLQLDHQRFPVDVVSYAHDANGATLTLSLIHI